MAIVEDNENELSRLWSLIQELSKQLNQNRSLSVSLVTQTGDVKVLVVALSAIKFHANRRVEPSCSCSDWLCLTPVRLPCHRGMTTGNVEHHRFNTDKNQG